jgi:hypothetical protein
VTEAGRRAFARGGGRTGRRWGLAAPSLLSPATCKMPHPAHWRVRKYTGTRALLAPARQLIAGRGGGPPPVTGRPIARAARLGGRGVLIRLDLLRRDVVIRQQQRAQPAPAANGEAVAVDRLQCVGRERWELAAWESRIGVRAPSASAAAVRWRITDPCPSICPSLAVSHEPAPLLQMPPLPPPPPPHSPRPTGTAPSCSS